MSEVLAVVSDLHANARALRAALADADAAGFDRLVILGDLLTYGVDRDEVLDLVEERIARGADLVLGNHDQLYLDLSRGERAYYDKLPAWLQETVDHTVARLDAARFAALPFVDDLRHGRWWLSHANPFAPRDWRYLASADTDGHEAAGVLRGKGLVGGVFGHTHRRKAWAYDGAGRVTVHHDGFETPEDGSLTWVLNAGSIGQPRHVDRATTWLRLVHGDGRASGELRAVTWDVDAHRAAVAGSGLSEPTVARLLSFFD
ncbi:MAG: metallophosphoesterase family protein [Alphaproteobacteria bacterium]|nr:metallophosphoesterase family protein [Alphaproteobacteria bacterium]